MCCKFSPFVSQVIMSNVHLNHCYKYSHNKECHNYFLCQLLSLFFSKEDQCWRCFKNPFFNFIPKPLQTGKVKSSNWDFLFWNFFWKVILVSYLYMQQNRWLKASRGCHYKGLRGRHKIVLPEETITRRQLIQKGLLLEGAATRKGCHQGVLTPK